MRLPSSKKTKKGLMYALHRPQRTGPGGGAAAAAAPGTVAPPAASLKSMTGSAVVAASTASGETDKLSGRLLVARSSDVHGTWYRLERRKRGEQFPVSCTTKELRADGGGTFATVP